MKMKMKMKINRQRATIFLFMLFFALQFSLPSTTAVPASRILEPPSTHVYTSSQRQVKEGRIDVELMDYSGTGANNHHDPISPPGR